MNFPKVLKKARERAGLSQAQVAEKMEVAVSTVAGWESGTHGCRIDKLPKLAEILATTPAKLMAAA